MHHASLTSTSCCSCSSSSGSALVSRSGGSSCVRTPLCRPTQLQLQHRASCCQQLLPTATTSTSSRQQHLSVLLRPRSSSQPQSDTQQQPQQTKEELEAALKHAIAAEDYSTAARLKEQLHELDMQDPLTGLKWALESAIEEERYQDAARLRDQIKELQDANKPQQPDLQGMPTSSDTLTEGIRVKVQSYYVAAQSRPELGQFFFAYNVSISNEGSKIVMLERRHWVITDGNGKVDHVRGPGVVGEQPILQPGKVFEYSSACPLYTTAGMMEGEYEFVTLNEAGEWMDRLEVKIGRFALIKPDMA